MSEILKDIYNSTEGLIFIVGAISGGLAKIASTATIREWLGRTRFFRDSEHAKRAVPYVAVALGVVIMALDAYFNQGLGRKAIIKLVIDGILAGTLAIGGHETIAKLMKKGPPTPPAASVVLAFLFWGMMALVAGIVTMAGLSSCKHVDTGCAIIDVANTACQKLRYKEDDGTIREVPVSNEDAKAIGRAAAVRQLSSDAGRDGASP